MKVNSLFPPLLWMLLTVFASAASAQEISAFGEDRERYCSQWIAKAKLTPEEYAEIRAWENAHLNQAPRPFLRAWRTILHRRRGEWMEFCRTAGPENCAGYHRELGVVRSWQTLQKIITRLVSGKEGDPPEISQVRKVVQEVRSTEPVFAMIRETDVEGVALPPLALGRELKRRNLGHLRANPPPELSDWIATDGDEVLPESEYAKTPWAKSGVASPYTDGMIPHGYRKSFTYDPYEQYFFELRDLEHSVLKLQRELGQIDDEIPELLAGDLLSPDQTLLFEMRTEVPMTGTDMLKNVEQWAAAGRVHYPIAHWQGEKLQDLGKFIITDAVLRIVRNYEWPHREKGARRLSHLQMRPLQWERTHLPGEALSRLSRRVRTGKPMQLRYEIGRAYGRDPSSFTAVLGQMLKTVILELRELRKMGFRPQAMLEAHAGSRQLANYYMDFFGLSLKAGVAMREDHWVLEGDIKTVGMAVISRILGEKAREQIRPVLDSE